MSLVVGNFKDIISMANKHPTYVMVAGGIAVGKTHVISKFLPLPLMDIDEVMEELSYTDYAGDQFKHALSVVSERINELMKNKISFIAMGTASRIEPAISRLNNAKNLGYKTALLYISASLEQAIRQNEKRKNNGQRYVREDEIYLIEQTIVGAKNTVDIIKDDKNLIDLFCHYNNSY
ncbi:MAG: zeta toxin family protein [Candidimonas sp.]